jgi:hypothetical protein
MFAALDRARHGYETHSAFLVQTISLEFLVTRSRNPRLVNQKPCRVTKATHLGARGRTCHTCRVTTVIRQCYLPAWLQCLTKEGVGRCRTNITQQKRSRSAKPKT